MSVDVRKRSLTSMKNIMLFGIVTRMLLQFKSILKGESFTDLDTYNFIFANIMLVSGLIAESFIYTLVPIFREIYDKEGDERLFPFMNNLIHISIIIIGGLSIIGLFIIPKRYGIDPVLLGLGLPMLVLAAIRTILLSLLITKHGFMAGARGGVARSMTYVLYLFFLGDRFGVRGLMVVGIIAKSIQIYIAKGVCAGDAYGNYKYKFNLDFKDSYLPKTLGTGVIIIITAFVYGLIATDKHSNTFMSYYNGWFLGALFAVMYPVLVEAFANTAEGNRKTFNDVLSNILSFLIKTLIPVFIMLLVNSKLIQNLFLESNDLPNLLFYYGFGLIALVLLPITFRALLAQGDIMGYVFTVVTMFILHKLLPNITSPFIALYSQDIVLFIGLILSLVLINKNSGFFKDMSILKDLGTQLQSGGIMLIFILFIRLAYTSFMSSFFQDELVPILIMAIVGTYIYWQSNNKLEKSNNSL